MLFARVPAPPGHCSRSVVLLLLFLVVAYVLAAPVDAAARAKKKALSVEGGLKLEVPDTWVVQPPASGMRKGQWQIPPSGGDPEPAELVLFYFGPGQGGTVQENLDRWFSLWQSDDGKPIKDTAKVETRKVGELNVTRVDVSGRYVGAKVPGGTEKMDKAGWRMLAAVVETRTGPYFLRLLGPAKTVQANQAAFDAVITSLKHGG
ncbi:MAG: hypothetical protein AB2A00_20495 [Myxococcota bacterium]